MRKLDRTTTGTSLDYICDLNRRLSHEIKYLINQADFINLRLRLSKVMKRDKNINADGIYTVRSLYFDDYFII